MAYFLKDFQVDGGVRRRYGRRDSRLATSSTVDTLPSFRRLIRDCFARPASAPVMRTPSSGDAHKAEQRCVRLYEEDALSWRSCEAVATPSNFGAFAIARQIVFKYANYLELIPDDTEGLGTGDEDEAGTAVDFDANPITGPDNHQHLPPGVRQQRRRAAHNDHQQRHQQQLLSSTSAGRQSGGKALSIGLNCLFGVLADLSKKDPELCCNALNSLYQLLQQLRPDSLASEPAVFINNLCSLLENLSKDACEEVRSRALTCLIGLAIGAGSPETLLRAIQALFTAASGAVDGDVTENDRGGDVRGRDDESDEEEEDTPTFGLPDNLRQLGAHMFHIVSGALADETVQLATNQLPLAAATVCDTPIDRLHAVIDLSLPFNDVTGDEEKKTVLSSKRRAKASAASAVGGGAIACDGAFVYALTAGGLYKLGTGLNDTIPNHEYSSNTSLKAAPGSWLVLCNGSLYLRRKNSSRLWVLDTDSLREIGEILLPPPATTTTLCSDGRTFRAASMDAAGQLTLTTLSDDTFTPVTGDGGTPQTQRYRLVDTAFQSHGDGGVQVLECLPELKHHLCRQAADLQTGKDIAVLLARSGKIYYSGRGSKVGLQDTARAWMELVLPEPIVAISVSPDSNNLCLRSGAGHVWIAGSATLDMGCNGVQSMPKRPTGGAGSCRLRRLMTANRKKCLSAAVSAAALAYVTENGRVFLNGRHSIHCLPETGQVVGLENVHLVSVALGKTHAVALSRHGHVYTWGFNNLFQCGRSEPINASSAMDAHSLDGTATTSSNDTMGGASIVFSLCPPTEHIWFKDVPTLCTACGLCTAHGRNCTSSASPSPAKTLGGGAAAAAAGGSAGGGGGRPTCGAGESGCLRCGVCRRCGERGDGAAAGDGVGEDGTETTASSERSHRMLLAPARVLLTGGSIGALGDVKVASVSCGNYHTVLLTADGQVLTFGSNCHGQLGVGDTRRRIGPQRVELPDPRHIVQVAAGANHCVVRSADGYALTFGSYRSGQLGRACTEANANVLPGYVESVNPELGVVARWVGATATATLVQYTRQIISAEALLNGEIVANQRCMIIFPPPPPATTDDGTSGDPADYRYLVLNLKTRNFHCVKTESDVPYGDMRWCLDPAFDVLWVHMVRDHSVHGLTNWAPNQMLDRDADLSFVKSPCFWTPTLDSEMTCSARFLAISLLTHVYVASKLTAPGFQLKRLLDGASRAGASTASTSAAARSVSDETSAGGTSSQRRSTVSRFQGLGGGWGYSAHSVEAIQFQCSRTILLQGLSLFGGRGEYLARMKLLYLVGGEYDERNLELLAETDEMLFDCAPREKAQLLFAKPVLCKANRWYIAWVQINGPSSDCGAGGATSVVGDDGASTFLFRNSRLSNNGTDVNVGQIPALLYTALPAGAGAGEGDAEAVMTASTANADDEDRDEDGEMQAKLTQFTQLQNFSSTACSLLLSICSRALSGAFRHAPLPGDQPSDHAWYTSEKERWTVEQYSIAVIMALRLLKRTLVHILGLDEPHVWLEAKGFAPVVADCRQLLDRIYELGESVTETDARSYIVEEALVIESTCLDVFYPSVQQLRGALQRQVVRQQRNDWRFVSTLECLAVSPSILAVLCQQQQPSRVETHTRQTRPSLLAPGDTPTGERQQSTTSPAMISLPSLVKLLLELAFVEPKAPTNSCYVRERLKSAAAHVLTRLFKELSCADLDADQPVLETPSRFRKTSANPNWDMTTGAADAVAFRVDRAGSVLCGVSVYIGTASDYQFSVELVLNQSDMLTKESWHILEKVTGTVSVSQQHYKETAFILFNKPVKLLPQNLYAIRIFLQGGKTWAGDWGIESTTAANGTIITYEVCSLSLNGTNVSRGQIPSLLTAAESISEAELKCNKFDTAKQFMQTLKLLSVKFMNCLQSGNAMSMVSNGLFKELFGWTMIFLPKNPTCCLDVIGVLDELMPLVASHNEQHHSTSARSEKQVCQTVVESNHPYSANSMFSQIVHFDSNVRIMCVEFSKECCTAQPEDVVTIYIQLSSGEFHPVLQFSGGKSWPLETIMLPGNVLWFMLEASHKSESLPEKSYGFRCTITGYKENKEDPLIQLEQEIVWLCSFACRTVFENPPVANCDNLTIESETHELLRRHGSLMRKGLALSRCPTVHEAMTKSMPVQGLSQEIKFLKEFIAASSSTLAGGLARWLTVEPVIDIENCELSVPAESICIGHPVLVHLILKDQLGRMARCAEVKCMVTVKAGTQENSYPSMKNLPEIADIQKEAYQPTYLNKARYIAVTMMQKFQNFSFEELRMGYFRDAVMKEDITMQLRHNLLEGTWIPKYAGTFRIECRLDGFQLSQTYHVDVFNDEAVAQSRTRSKRRVAQLSKARFAVPEMTSLTRGIRVRAAPSLVALQVAIVQKGSVISYIEEIQNSDGTWLRLTDESIVLLCGSANFINQAWILQYNKHLERTLLVKTLDEGTIVADGIQHQSIVIETQEKYQVLANYQHSAEGHSTPVYSGPSMNACTDVLLAPGTMIQTNAWIHNSEGIWVRLVGTEQYCMAQSKEGTIFLDRKVFSASQSSASTSSSYDDPSFANGNSSTAISHEGRRQNSLLRKKPQATVQPSPQTAGKPTEAMRPSKIDCSRSVFAAFVWHEGFVKDVMACAAYLRFHPELHISNIQNEAEHLPSPLVPIIRLWTEINTAVQSSIQQHIVLPMSPPMVSTATMTSNQNRRQASTGSSSSFLAVSTGGQEMCELCEEWFLVPVTNHMRVHHPGCGRHSGGHGYNSMGKYTSGWSGNCGEGGRHPATWYLMCALCRRRYQRKTPSVMRQDRNRRTCTLRATLGSMESHNVIKTNAMFLLELNQSSDVGSKATSENSSGWTVNLFPQSSSPPSITRSSDVHLDESNVPTQSNEPSPGKKINYASHASDPGPKLPISMANSIPCKDAPSAQIFRRRVTAADTYHQTVSGAGVLRSPSKALRSFITSQNNQPANVSAVLRRPILDFVTHNHDLRKIREAIEAATFRAVIFSHCFKVWNWLLRLVSTEGSVSDVLWHYLSALNSYKSLVTSETNDSINTAFVMPHPWRICFLAGPLANQMVCSFHALLHTISVILRSDCVEPSLRRLCFRSWTFNLTIHEQDLVITTCNILSTVGRVLAEPSDAGWLDDDLCLDYMPPAVRQLDNLSKALRIEASSRSAMTRCLTDGNSETFWESGDEDKQKAKHLSVFIDHLQCDPLLVGVHIDNERDEGFRTSHVAFHTLNAAGRRNKTALAQHNVGPRFIGWVKCYIPQLSRLQIELRSPDASLRIHHLCVMGKGAERQDQLEPNAEPGGLKPSPSHLSMFTAAQLDAFQLFQAIASQAFTDEFSTEQNGTLRQQVLDLLFSRIQLQPLQGYVCSQIVVALEKEVCALRERVKRNYSYCCGLLSMLAKICTSRCPVEALGGQGHLLTALSELLLFSSSTVVQCQCLDTIEKVLLHVTPTACDVGAFATNLFVAVAKQISIQVRQRTTHAVSSASMLAWLNGEAPAFWRLDRPPSVEITRLVKTLLIETAYARFGDHWARAIRQEIAASVMYFTTIPEEARHREQCLKSRRFWVSTSALAVLKDELWLKSSPPYQLLQKQAVAADRAPLCENHDDGATPAALRCDVCASALCRDCYTVLHLRRRTRTHTVHMLAVGDVCPELDIHEGSTRFRLPWLLILLNGTAMNGMLEFCNADHDLPLVTSGPTRTGSTSTSPPVHHPLLPATSARRQCRFCGNPTSSELTDVCDHAECQALVETACCR